MRTTRGTRTGAKTAREFATEALINLKAEDRGRSTVIPDCDLSPDARHSLDVLAQAVERLSLADQERVWNCVESLADMIYAKKVTP